jgi:membrane fusion protein, multidrug efflux system
MILFPRKRISSLLIGASLVVLAIGACSRKSREEGGDSSSGPTAEVTLTRVVRADISQTFSLTGTAAALPNQDVKVSALVPGRVAELRVAEGDAVKEGQVLAKLDDRTYRDQLQQAEAAEQQAQANLENAKLSRTRNEDLFQRGIAARKELEDSRTQESIAAAGLKQAQAALEIARLNVARTEIVSPLNGTIAKRFVSVGEQVDGTAAQPIVEVANLREVEFLGNAPAAYLAKMKPGEAVDVTSEAVPGLKFPGRVVATSPSIDPATGVGFVRIRLPNPNSQLRLGMFLSAEISVDTHRHVLVVPAQSIYKDEGGQPRVFVVNQDSATAVPVRLGIEATNRVELAEANGVKEGDNIILAGGYGLGDKAKVLVQPKSDQ